MNPKLLIVDDELDMRLLLKDLLSDSFNIETASNGVEGLEKVNHWKPDLVLMDLKMPEMDGANVCRIMREHDLTRHIPVLILTGANTSAERMRAFDLGADDFIFKPFEVEELKSRLISKLKRSQELRNIHVTTEMTVGNLAMNDKKHEVTIDSKKIELSPVEYGILKLLMSHVEEVVSREEIMATVWEDKTDNPRLINAHITSLRKKLQNFSGDFHTVYGAGYSLKEKKT